MKHRIRILTVVMNFLLVISLVKGLIIMSSEEASAKVVGIWLFDEGKGDTVKDVSGNGHDGKIVGKVSWDEGKFGKALKFEGGHVAVIHKDDLDLVNFSMSAWVKVPAISEPYQMIVGKEAWPARNYSMWIRPDVFVFGYTTNGGATDNQIPSKSVIDDKWHHLVGVYDGKSLTAYVDGTLSNQRPFGGKPETNKASLMIGAQPPNGLGPLKGHIDEVAIYDSPLTEKEVQKTFSGLASSFFAVEPVGKLATSWGRIKTERFKVLATSDVYAETQRFPRR